MNKKTEWKQSPWKMPPYLKLPVLFDGSKESVTDQMVMTAIASKLRNVKETKLKTDKKGKVTAGKWYIDVVFNIKEITDLLSLHRITVQASLERLQAAQRIRLTSKPCRGRNSTYARIGIKYEVLFSPILKPEKLFDTTLETIKKERDMMEAIRLCPTLLAYISESEDTEWKLNAQKEIDNIRGSIISNVSNVAPNKVDKVRKMLCLSEKEIVPSDVANSPGGCPSFNTLTEKECTGSLTTPCLHRGLAPQKTTGSITCDVVLNN